MFKRGKRAAALTGLLIFLAGGLLHMSCLAAYYYDRDGHRVWRDGHDDDWHRQRGDHWDDDHHDDSHHDDNH